MYIPVSLSQQGKCQEDSILQPQLRLHRLLS